MAPKPTSKATLPSVPPKLLISTSFTMLLIGRPVAMAVSRLTNTIVSKACRRNLIISTKISAIAPSAIPSKGPAPNVCVQFSIE